MKNKSTNLYKFIKHQSEKIIFSLILIILILVTFGVWENLKDNKEIKLLENNLKELNQSTQETISNLETQLDDLSNEKRSLENILTEEQKVKVALENEKIKNENKIDKLEKLTTIDPELLKKYSKVYFLSDNYSPPETSTIDRSFWINPEKEIEALEEVKPFLENLLEDAEDDGLNLKVLSGYRSFDQQASLKSSYTVLYGSGANQFSADQGYSEHQLGTTFDFTTPSIVGADIEFENTEEFKWLKDNAENYGFVLSYPEENGYYIYEPWHWRFVGIRLAKDLKEDGEHFYERDQRSLDRYLINIFDK